MRFPHLLRRVLRASFPTTVIVVACDAIEDLERSTRTEKHYTLTRWASSGMRGEKGSYGHSVSRQGTDAAGFWVQVSAQLARGGTVYCMWERIGVDGTLLGLWERLESGALLLCAADRRGTPLRPGRQRGAAEALCVIEDPPVIIDIRVPGKPGRMRILSMDNYGWTAPAGNAGCVDRAYEGCLFIRKICNLLATEKLGGLQCTTAGQSWHSWRYAHLDTLVHCHANTAALNLEKDAYYGGRCEAYTLGRLPSRVYHLDCSAMYTALCARRDLPCVLVGTGQCAEVCSISETIAERCAIVEARVTTDEPAYPVRTGKDQLTVWPVGTFNTWLCGPEFVDAWVRNRVVKVHRYALYECRPILQSYARHILRLRGQYASDTSVLQYIKALGVCAVGQLGRRSRTWEDATTLVFHAPWAQWYTYRDGQQAIRWRSIAGHTQLESSGEWHPDSIPGAAAWVTSLGRMQLLRWIRIAGWENVYYVDTDGLMVNENGYQSLRSAGAIRSSAPGYLRLKWESSNVTIYGIKHYVHDGHVVCAGVSPHSAQERVEGDPQAERVRLRAHPASHIRPTGSDIVSGKPNLQRYRHGTVSVDGRVTPFRFGEPTEE